MARRTLGLTALRGAGDALGFILALLQAAIFGVGASVDALFAATFVAVLWAREMARVVRLALIPCLVEAESGTLPADFMPAFRALLLAVVLGVSIALGAGAPWIVRLVSPGFDAATADLTARLLRILAPSAGALILFGAAQAVCHVRRRFLLPEALDALGKTLAMLALLTLGIRYGVTGFAAGLAAAAVLQTTLLLTVGRGLGLALLPRPGAPVRFSALRPFWRGALVVFCAVSLRQVDQAVDRIFLSFLPAGALSVFSHASRLVQVTPFLLATSILMPLLPELARVRAHAPTEARRMARQAGLLLLAAGAPLALIIGWGARDLVDFLLVHGRFDPAAATTTAAAAQAFAFGIPAVFLVQGLNGAFLVERNLQEILRTGVAMLLFHTTASVLLIRYGVPGLALAGSLATWLSAAYLWRRARAHTPRRLYFPWARFVTGLTLAAAVLFLPPWFRLPGPPVLRLALGAALAASIYLALLAPTLPAMRSALRTTPKPNSNPSSMPAS